MQSRHLRWKVNSCQSNMATKFKRIDERHPKIAAMMEPRLAKYLGWCLVSSTLIASNKRYDSLHQLEAYLACVCWLNSIAICPHGTQCSFAAGHVKKGKITDAHADNIVRTMQEGVTALVNRHPMPPNRKRKWMGQGRGGGLLPRL